VDVIQYAVSRPPLVPLIDRRERWKIMRELSPRTAGPRAVPNGVHDLSRVVLRLLEIPDPDRSRKQLGDETPFGIRQVGRIALAGRPLVDTHVRRFGMTSLVRPNFLMNTL